MEKDFLQHVFISYSRKDKTVKDKIVKDFEVANIPVWFDTDRIKHDTPNFENDIRKALKESFGFVLVASPRSCESEWVLSEIQIAKDYGVPIYPVRAYDAPWSECLPMSMSRKNGIDCQGANYGTGIIELVQALKEKRDEKLPYLVEVSENTRMPRCYLSITTTSHKRLLLQPDHYPTVQKLLHDLYINYLADDFPTFTYGSEWIIASVLRQKKGFRRLSVPLSWLTRPSPETPISTHDPSWQSGLPASFGLNPSTRWEIIPAPYRGFALATNDDFLIKQIESLTIEGIGSSPHGTLIKYLPISSKLVEPENSLLSNYKMVALLSGFNIPFDTQKYDGRAAILDGHFL